MHPSCFRVYHPLFVAGGPPGHFRRRGQEACGGGVGPQGAGPCACVSVCVCERERERESLSERVSIHEVFSLHDML